MQTETGPINILLVAEIYKESAVSIAKEAVECLSS